MLSLQDTSASSLECIVEVCTDSERRAFARGRLRDLPPGLFELTPLSLRGLFGRTIIWPAPPKGAPLPSLISFPDLHDALMWWATQTVANCASARR